MVTRIVPRLAGLVFASSLMPIAGMATLSQPAPVAPAAASAPARSGYEAKVSDEAVMITNYSGYGDFGGAGNPYGPAPTGYSGSPVPAGPFSDQLPLTSAPPVGSPA